MIFYKCLYSFRCGIPGFYLRHIPKNMISQCGAGNVWLKSWVQKNGHVSHVQIDSLPCCLVLSQGEHCLAKTTKKVGFLEVGFVQKRSLFVKNQPLGLSATPAIDLRHVALSEVILAGLCKRPHVESPLCSISRLGL